MELYRSPLFSDANLLAYFRFNSGALTTDSKGSYTLTNNNTVGETASGKFGYAADFGSSNTNKSFSRTDACGLGGSKSISMWVKLNTEISTGIYIILYSYNKVDGREFNISYEYNGGTRRLSFGFSKADVAAIEIPYNITLGTSNWYHLVITTDNNNCTAYVNGEQVGTTTASGTGSTGYNAVFGIGCGVSVISYAQSNFASAIIDDIALFSRVLTSTEISKLYKAGATGNFIPFFM